MALVNAALHCSSSSIDLGSLSRFGLGEYGEEHDDPSGGGVVADSGLLAVEVEAQLAELAVELSGERFAEVDALFGEQIDVSLDLTELVVRQRIQPTGYSGSASIKPQPIADMLSPILAERMALFCRHGAAD